MAHYYPGVRVDRQSLPQLEGYLRRLPKVLEPQAGAMALATGRLLTAGMGR
ncbi:MAG TPA: hypothetical protein VGM37_10450 [Armatimonadota bacterium]|jgi:hypothetical protein